MINHGRTLLLNLPALDEASEEYFDEYIPASFSPRLLPGYLQSVFRQLYGTNPDRWMRNYRVHGVMRLLHAEPRFDAALRYLDPRVTYIREQDGFRDFYRLFGIRISPINHSYPLFVTGTPPESDITGRLFNRWRVQESGGSLQVFRETDAHFSTTALQYSDGLSGPVTLAGSNIQVRLHDSWAGSSWFVDAYSRPKRNLATVLNELRAIPDVIANVFMGQQELKKLYQENIDFVTQFGAFFMAVINKIDRLHS